MYLPLSVPLSRPHVAMWYGRSGKRYDFAVSRARPMWLGHPVVYVLVRYDGDRAVPLFAGRATASHPQLGGPGSEAIAAWEQAMALGVTHVHLRFEACTDEDRAAEVEDLVEGIRPPLNGVDAPSGQEDLEPAAADPAAADPAAADPAAAEPAAAETAAAGMSLGDVPSMEVAMEVAVASAPQVPVGAVRPPRHGGGWLGRTASALMTRYRHWRLDHAAVAAAAPPGRVTVRAGAIAVEGPKSAAAAFEPHPVALAELASTLAVEPDAVAPAISSAPPPPAQPAALTVDAPQAEGHDARTVLRQRLGFGDEDVVVLFAGELTWAAGADLVVEAMATVHPDPAAVRLLLVGEGPLRADLEGRAWHGGYAHACRFTGDLAAEAFAELFTACDAVVIPARSAQSSILAEHSLGAGKPLLTTHQAQLGCIRHGENGLVTYDNPGSLVWGLREIRALVAQRRTPAALAA